MNDLDTETEKEMDDFDDDEEIDESELDEAILDDLLPVTEEKQTVVAKIYSKKTKSHKKITFIIRKGISFPDLVEADKALYDIDKKGTITLNFLNFIIKIWPKFVVEQPVFFAQQLRNYVKDMRAMKKGPLKNSLCKIDGFIMREVIQTVYEAFKGEYDIDIEKEKQIKN